MKHYKKEFKIVDVIDNFSGQRRIIGNLYHHSMISSSTEDVTNNVLNVKILLRNNIISFLALCN